MAEFSKVTVTEAGMRLLELSETMSQPLVFTKMEIGSGRPIGAEDVAKYTALKNQVIAATISKVARVKNDDLSEARAAIYCAFSNDSVTEGFYMNEVGLYAKVSASSYSDSGWNGYQGEEQLFGYAYALEGKADWLPDKSTPLDIQEYVIYTTIGNASSVAVAITAETMARAADLNSHILDTDPHHDVFSKYVKKAGDTMTGNLTVPTVIGNLKGKADTAGLADKAGTLDGDAGLWNYLHRKGYNFVPPTANQALNALGMFISSYNTVSKFKNQPTRHGQLVNIPHGKDNAESTQFWIEQNSGRLYHRGGNGSIVINDTPFTRFLDTNDLSALGVVAGNVSNANAWWVKLGGTIPLIIQGGYYRASDKTYKLNYPIKFPNRAISISIVTDSYINNSDANYPVIGGAFTSSSVTINNNTWDNRYIVIGY